MNNSYNKDRQDYNLYESGSSLRNTPWFRIEYIDSDQFKIYPYSKEQYKNKFNFNMGYYDEIESISEYLIDLTTTEMSKLEGKSGILDNLASSNDPKVAERFMLLFALGSKTDSSIIPDGKSDIVSNDFIGFGCFHQPRSVITAYATGTQDEQSDITLDSTAYNTAFQFTEGARCLIWYSGTNYNSCIIEEIYDKDTMRVRLENLYNFGTTLTGAVNFDIVQLDNFRPYIANEKNTNYSDYYQLISGTNRLDASSNLQPFEYYQGNVSIVYGTYLSAGSGNRLVPLYDYISPTATICQGALYSNTDFTINNSVVGSIYNVERAARYASWQFPPKHLLLSLYFTSTATPYLYINKYTENI